MSYAFLHQIDSRQPGERLSLWLPGDAVVCHLVEVPDVPAAKWRAMIPWLLEDQLLAPPEALAFFPGQRQGNQVPVLVVATDTLAAWRGRLRERGIPCDRMVPDYFALPWQPGEISLFRGGDRCLVRYGQWQGSAGPEAVIWPLLATLDDGQRVLRVFCDHQDDVPEPWRERVRLQSPAGLFDAPAGDWLDIPGESGTGRRRWSRTALAAAVAGVSAIVLWSAALALENQRIDRQAAHFESELKRGYQQYFGERYNFALADFQSVVSRRLDGGEDAPISRLLDRLAAVIAQCGDCRLQHIAADGAVLTAHIEGDGEVLAAAGAVPAQTGSGWVLTLRAGA